MPYAWLSWHDLKSLDRVTLYTSWLCLPEEMLRHGTDTQISIESEDAVILELLAPALKFNSPIQLRCQVSRWSEVCGGIW